MFAVSSVAVSCLYDSKLRVTRGRVTPRKICMNRHCLMVYVCVGTAALAPSASDKPEGMSLQIEGHLRVGDT